MPQELVSTNPSRNYEELGSVEVSSTHDIQAAVAAARTAQSSWQGLGVTGRAALLRQVGAKFREQAEDIAALIAQEMGMPIREARDDVAFAFDYLDAYIEQAQHMLQPRITYENKREVHTVY